MSKRITQIPFPGSSGQTPTGAMQFQNDWPALFVRVDKAVALLHSIRVLQERLANHLDVDVVLAMLRLGEIADTIDRDVIVRSERA